MNLYPMNSVVTVTANFAQNNVLTNPTTVILRYKDPSGTETVVNTGSLNNPSAGVFNSNITGNKAGVWYYRFEGSGSLIAVQEGNFVITSSPFPDAAP